MEELKSVPLWEPPPIGQSTWEDMLNDLLQDPATEPGGACEVKSTLSVDDEGLLGLVNGSFDDVIGFEEGPQSGVWWTGAPGDAVLDQIDYPDLSTTFLVQEDVSVPGLSSEVSSFADDEYPVVDKTKSGEDNLKASDDAGVSSPGSCNGAETDCRPSSHSADEVEIVSSGATSPIVTSCSDQKAASPDTGCDSTDVGAMGRSCDNFADLSERRGNSSPGEIDEDAKRQSRLMRNRESATQSRLRKKSYMKDLEAKCRAMESQLSMLHQTVAFTSAQNAALREELAHVKSLKGNGSKSGAMEPAALPSDSLPSESPSRHTCQCRSVKLELVAFLCHVLLLTLFQALPLKPVASGGNAPNGVKRGRLVAVPAVRSIQRFGKVSNQSRKRRLYASSRRKKKISSRWGDISWAWCRTSLIPSGSMKLSSKCAETRMQCRQSVNKSSRRLFRRTQYNTFC